MTPLRILSLWPPWAHAIACGLKQVDTRGWHLTEKQMGQLPTPLLIHATKRWDGEMWAYHASLMRSVCAQVGLNDPRAVRYAESPAAGCIVAACRLVDCRVMGCPSGGRLNPWVEELPEIERILGDYIPGRFGLFLKDVRPLPEPLPWKGRQGKLLAPPEELVAAVEEQLGGPL